jgi:hypothetical protein
MRVDRLLGLLQWLCTPPVDPDLVAEVAAECAIRAWLEKEIEPWIGAEIPPRVIPSEMAEQLRQWLQRNQDNRLMVYDGCRPDFGEPGFPVISNIERSLSMWRQAHGFVPLVIRNDGQDAPEAIALPFVIQRRGHRVDPFVATADGIQPEVAGLRSAWDRAWRAAVQYGWVSEGDLLQARMIGLSPAMAGLPQGNSATLPFLIAIFQHARGLRVPPLEWAASGEVDVEFCKSPELGALTLEWEAKKRLIERIEIPINRRIYPASADAGFERLLVSSFGDYVIQPNLEETNRELLQIDDLMRNGRPDLHVLASQLDRLMGSVGDLPGLQWDVCRSRMIKLRADLYCHQGLPDRCIQLLPEREHTLAKSREGCDALNRIAVACTDLCRHDQCESLTTLALDGSADLSRLDDHIVRLHALGTRGQGRMYQALETSDEELARSGLEDLEKALRLARELDQGEPPGNWAQARNQTYLLLWHALHQPERAGYLYFDALKLARESRHGEGYVNRAAYLARYRSLLAGGDSNLPWWPAEDPSIPDPAFADGWLAATALKYRGACRAVLGDLEGAKADFEHASEILKPVSGWLLAFIRATILIESACSLRQLGPEHVEPLVREASAILRQIHDLGEFNPDSPASPARWVDFAEALANPNGPLPEPDPRMIFAY